MKKLIDPSLMMNATNAAKYLEIERRNIYNWVASGKLPFIETWGGDRFYQKKDLDKALANSRIATTQIEK